MFVYVTKCKFIVIKREATRYAILNQKNGTIDTRHSHELYKTPTRKYATAACLNGETVLSVHEDMALIRRVCVQLPGLKIEYVCSNPRECFRQWHFCKLFNNWTLRGWRSCPQAVRSSYRTYSSEIQCDFWRSFYFYSPFSTHDISWIIHNTRLLSSCESTGKWNNRNGQQTCTCMCELYKDYSRQKKGEKTRKW